MDERFYYLALRHQSAFGARVILKLISFFGSAKKLWEATADELLSIENIEHQRVQKYLHDRDAIDIDAILSALKNRTIDFTAICDDNYPLMLKEIYDPPLILFTRGQPLSNRQYTLGIVGTRRATAYGKRATEMIVQGMASIQGVIVSGMAKGIDSVAHTAALHHQLYTIAVLGTGVDVIYPYENKQLYEKICENGTIVSELLPGATPERFTFPLRNRIISGLSRGIVVVEASFKSGALITAKYALEQNRDIFAVPGSVFSDGSTGVHYLLKEGALFLEKPDDIFKQWNIRSTDSVVEKIAIKELTTDEKTIIDVLAAAQGTAMTVDDIYARVAAKMPLSGVMSTLMLLALKNVIDEVQGKQYMLIKEVVS